MPVAEGRSCPCLTAKARSGHRELASEGARSIDSLEAWPGIGHVAREGDGFCYFPQPLQMQR
jgi:hypothetical protein